MQSKEHVTKFGDLRPGDTFRFQGRRHMKTPLVYQRHSTPQAFNAVRSDGRLTGLGPDFHVKQEGVHA